VALRSSGTPSPADRARARVSASWGNHVAGIDIAGVEAAVRALDDQVTGMVDQIDVVAALPPSPIIVSAPPPPLIRLSPALPVIVFERLLPASASGVIATWSIADMNSTETLEASV